jgi:hypothetical protein
VVWAVCFFLEVDVVSDSPSGESVEKWVLICSHRCITSKHGCFDTSLGHEHGSGALIQSSRVLIPERDHEHGSGEFIPVKRHCFRIGRAQRGCVVALRKA